MAQPASDEALALGKRPMNYWRPLNDWWRTAYDTLGARPRAKDVSMWYTANADTIWGVDKPTQRECIAHAKCLRSKQELALYHERYRVRAAGGPAVDLRRTGEKAAYYAKRKLPRAGGSGTDSDSGSDDDLGGNDGSSGAGSLPGPAVHACPHVPAPSRKSLRAPAATAQRTCKPQPALMQRRSGTAVSGGGLRVKDGAKHAGAMAATAAAAANIAAARSKLRRVIASRLQAKPAGSGALDEPTAPARGAAPPTACGAAKRGRASLAASSPPGASSVGAVRPGGACLQSGPPEDGAVRLRSPARGTAGQLAAPAAASNNESEEELPLAARRRRSDAAACAAKRRSETANATMAGAARPQTLSLPAAAAAGGALLPCATSDVVAGLPAWDGCQASTPAHADHNALASVKPPASWDCPQEGGRPGAESYGLPSWLLDKPATPLRMAGSTGGACKEARQLMGQWAGEVSERAPRPRALSQPGGGAPHVPHHMPRGSSGALESRAAAGYPWQAASGGAPQLGPSGAAAGTPLEQDKGHGGAAAGASARPLPASGCQTAPLHSPTSVPQSTANAGTATYEERQGASAHRLLLQPECSSSTGAGSSPTPLPSHRGHDMMDPMDWNIFDSEPSANAWEGPGIGTPPWLRAGTPPLPPPPGGRIRGAWPGDPHTVSTLPPPGSCMGPGLCTPQLSASWAYAAPGMAGAHAGPRGHAAPPAVASRGHDLHQHHHTYPPHPYPPHHYPYHHLHHPHYHHLHHSPYGLPPHPHPHAPMAAGPAAVMATVHAGAHDASCCGAAACYSPGRFYGCSAGAGAADAPLEPQALQGDAEAGLDADDAVSRLRESDCRAMKHQHAPGMGRAAGSAAAAGPDGAAAAAAAARAQGTVSDGGKGPSRSLLGDCGLGPGDQAGSRGGGCRSLESTHLLGLPHQDADVDHHDAGNADSPRFPWPGSASAATSGGMVLQPTPAPGRSLAIGSSSNAATAAAGGAAFSVDGGPYPFLPPRNRPADAGPHPEAYYPPLPGADASWQYGHGHGAAGEHWPGGPYDGPAYYPYPPWPMPPRVRRRVAWPPHAAPAGHYGVPPPAGYSPAPPPGAYPYPHPPPQAVPGSSMLPGRSRYHPYARHTAAPVGWAPLPPAPHSAGAASGHMPPACNGHAATGAGLGAAAIASDAAAAATDGTESHRLAAGDGREVPGGHLQYHHQQQAPLQARTPPEMLPWLDSESLLPKPQAVAKQGEDVAECRVALEAP